MREPEELTRGLDWIVGLKREGGAAIRKGRRRPGLRSLLSWRGCESATTSRPPKGWWTSTSSKRSSPPSRRGGSCRVEATCHQVA